MSGVRAKAQVSAVATGTALKTIMQLVAATNHGVEVEELSISFNGTSNSATPILVQIARQTTAGTMTSLTCVKDPDDFDETLQTTAQHTATAEPTLGDILEAEYVHPQQGYTWYKGPGREIKIGGGDRLAIVVTAAASVSAAARMTYKE